MRVRFEIGLGDVVDAHLRCMARDKAARAAYLKGYARSAGWGAVFALAFIAIAFPEWPLPGKLLFALGAAVLGAVLYWAVYEDEAKKALAKHFGEYFAGGERQVCEVELTEEGVRTRQFNSETAHDWQEVVEIRETPDSIDIFMRRCGFGVVVRKRAFSTRVERDEFVRFLERNSPAGIVRDTAKVGVPAAN